MRWLYKYPFLYLSIGLHLGDRLRLRRLRGSTGNREKKSAARISDGRSEPFIIRGAGVSLGGTAETSTEVVLTDSGEFRRQRRSFVLRTVPHPHCHTG